jgi:hypothetical protein
MLEVRGGTETVEVFVSTIARSQPYEFGQWVGERTVALAPLFPFIILLVIGVIVYKWVR